MKEQNLDVTSDHASHSITHSRREFLKQTAAAAAVASAVEAAAGADAPTDANAQQPPWYRRALRWGQTNITEIDPARYDIPWWRGFWKRTQVQGVIINGGGIVAYYPSKFPLQYRPPPLGERDLYGDLSKAAHEDGLAVLARMDSNRAHENFYRAHPDWFAIDGEGRPYRAADLYVTCINSPYYEQYLPDVLREIIARSHPEGITDNSWSGLGRDSICYCRFCSERFHAQSGKDLPRRHDWDDPVYRQWIQWSYARRLELWDLNNRVTKEAGGSDCLWIGMNSGSISAQSRSFRDMREVCARAQIILLDHQARSDSEGFQGNAEAGKLVHGILGWDKLIPESMAMYQAGKPTFRLASKPAAEARMWMLAGFAGGIQPWWHHISAYHEDRRQYRTAEPVMRWHKENEQYLINRRPVASVGIVWSQQNTDYYGRDNPDELVGQPWRGWSQAMVRGRIPFIPIHADDIDKESAALATLILPCLGVMSEAQIAAVRKFVEHGGGLIASGPTSLYDPSGQARADAALADLFGVSGMKPTPSNQRTRADRTVHSYLRLSPELRKLVDGPRSGDEPDVKGTRHPVLAGFDETDILPFGGMLGPLKVDASATLPLTFIPPFPIYPPETSWMRQPKTDIPGLVLNTANRARVAYLAADIDRRFALDNLPDHGDLLANIIRWTSGGNLPLEVRGPGLINCELYQQPGRLILHVINLTSAATWRQPIHELIPIGPLAVKVRIPDGMNAKSIRLQVSKGTTRLQVAGGWAQFVIPSVLDHELVIVES